MGAGHAAVLLADGLEFSVIKTLYLYNIRNIRCIKLNGKSRCEIHTEMFMGKQNDTVRGQNANH